jgi:hypothetical protein
MGHLHNWVYLQIGRCDDWVVDRAILAAGKSESLQEAEMSKIFFKETYLKLSGSTIRQS